MTPAARIQAAIDVLDRIDAGKPAEPALSAWARGARYAGSKDRAAVRDHVFQALRCWRSYAALGGAATGRGRMIGYCRATGLDLSGIFTGEGHAPAPLGAAEQTAFAAPAEGPEALDLPDWLWPLFRASLGERAVPSARALRDRAPVMLRVNLRKAPVSAALEALEGEGIIARPDPIAPAALLVTGGARRIAGSAAYRDGIVELQDGSSQAAMAGIALPDGARVLDYCAGGGGKTLALASRAEGAWHAHDALPGRLKDLPARAARAGIRVTRCNEGELAQYAPFDLVLCDVPCSGSGTWRRTPEAKWRLTPDRLDALAGMQQDILQRAAALVAPGGRLVYATCSVLHQENGAQMDLFCARNPAWAVVAATQLPISAAGDGFFIAQLTRQAEPD